MIALHLVFLIIAVVSGIGFLLQSLCTMMAQIALSLNICVKDYDKIVRGWYWVTGIFVVSTVITIALGSYNG